MISVRASPHTPSRKLAALPQTLQLDFSGPSSKRRHGRGRGKKERKSECEGYGGEKREGKKGEGTMGKWKRREASPQFTFPATPLFVGAFFISYFVVVRPTEVQKGGTLGILKLANECE